MARKPRIHFPGACYHVILRGNRGQDIFFEDDDRSQLLELLQECIGRYKCRVHCYCLIWLKISTGNKFPSIRIERESFHPWPLPH